MFVSPDNNCENTSLQIFLESIIILGLLLMATPLMALASSDDYGSNAGKGKSVPPAQTIQVTATVAQAVNWTVSILCNRL